MKTNSFTFQPLKNKNLLFVLSMIVILFACNGGKQKTKEEFSIDAQFKHAEKQLDGLVKLTRGKGSIPRSAEEDGTIRWTGSGLDWTEGFWPGTCWQLYQVTNDEKWKDAAIEFQSLFEEHKNVTTSHDLGFVFNNSFGKAFQITGEDQYKQVLIAAANSLITRFDPEIGCIESWDHNANWVKEAGYQFPVIIDNMMNLEMLFEVARLTGDNKYYDVAISHADTTMKYHFRDDYSTFHVVDYDTLTGGIDEKVTRQGYSDSSSWARGQAWGLYGYTVCYRYTKNDKYLDQAINIADYNIAQLPDDYVTYWDYDAPDIPNTYRDASAAAILASALIELSELSGNDNYSKVAMNILKELSTDKYTAAIGENSHFLLKHCVGDLPRNSEVDVPLNYADYYYIEALRRAKKLQEEEPV